MMYSLTDIAEIMGRHQVQLGHLLKRYGLPTHSGIGYSECYVDFFRQVIFLRLAQVPESEIQELWDVERKIMVLLHADSVGSPTWMIDGYAQSGHADRRLFLSRFDIGADLGSVSAQPGLDFSGSKGELFAAGEMGEDALRLIAEYRVQLNPILKVVAQQEGVLRAAGDWAGSVGKFLSAEDPS
ncbi:hypothetical protein [Haloferula sp.]|uniref:hypothetical protein n=1 Tax=Haloferula sp. TaxID=2497595 RepID=UPI0032A00041